MFYIAVDCLLVLGIVRDAILTKRVHPVYMYSLAGFLVCQFTVAHAIYHQSAYWLKVAHAILD